MTVLLHDDKFVALVKKSIIVKDSLLCIEFHRIICAVYQFVVVSVELSIIHVHLYLICLSTIHSPSVKSCFPSNSAALCVLLQANSILQSDVSALLEVSDYLDDGGIYI